MTLTPGERAFSDDAAGVPRGESAKASESVVEARETDEVRTAANATENTSGFPFIEPAGRAS